MSKWNPAIGESGPFGDAIRRVFGEYGKDVPVGDRFKLGERQKPDAEPVLVLFFKEKNGAWRAEAVLDSAGLHLRGALAESVDFTASEWRL
jgi:hypothetical protein